jgi:hypothetical protein
MFCTEAASVSSTPTPPANRQLPIGDEIFLDHVGHFVRDVDAATRALVRESSSTMSATSCATWRRQRAH